MRPVNLLPAKYRARGAGGTGGDSRATYVALGVLATLVLMVFGYVMAANSVSSKNAEIEEVRSRIQAAESRTVTLQSYGDFAGTKEARVAAVKALATTRLDWERLFRELAHVLPERVWLTTFNGTVASGAPTGTGATTDGPQGPAVNLEGCAASHSGVADVMVRLRELHGAEDVVLTESAKSEGGGASAGAAAPAGMAAAPDPSASGGSGCGPYTAFKIDVALSGAASDAAPAPADAAPAEVPARLGGGE